MITKQSQGLTGLIEKTIKNLPTGGHIKPILKWAKSQKHVEIEFENELLVIVGQKKIALNLEGKILWASDLGKDKQELKNEVSEQTLVWRISPRWRKIRRLAKNEVKKRSGQQWVWRNLQFKA